LKKSRPFPRLQAYKNEGEITIDTKTLTVTIILDGQVADTFKAKSMKQAWFAFHNPDKVEFEEFPYIEKRIQVYCSECGEFKDEKDTEFLNIEEDIQGADVLTFICPDCKTTQKSRRLG
jgi:hypothetical protein